MEPLIPDGSLIINCWKWWINRRSREDAATIKRVKFADDKIILMLENRNYDPIILIDKSSGRIIGKVILVDFDVE